MSTFLVSLGVVAATIAAVVHVVLNSPDQPATIRRQPSRAKARFRAEGQAGAEGRGKRRAGRRAPAQDPPVIPAVGPGPTLALPDSDVMRLRMQPAKKTTLWVRIRSGVVLILLVAVLGALLALVIGGLGLGVALLVRSATG